MIPVFRPSMGKEEIEAVAKVIESGWIGLGPKTEEFEKLFAQYTGAKNAVGLNSATAALHLAVKALELPKESEVLTSPITFVSTAMAASYNDHLPVFVDVDYDTLNMSLDDFQKKITKKSKVVIPVHYGGLPVDLKALTDIAKDKGIAVIDDCAHAAGSEYKGKKIGTGTLMSTFSFHAVKNLATADGGMITTDDDKLAEKIRMLRWVGIDRSTYARAKSKAYKWDYDVIELGYKYHPNDILSAIGVVQLSKLDKKNDRRRKIFKMYNEALQTVNWIHTPVELKDSKSACHNYVMKVPEQDREDLITHLNNKGISAGVHYKPVYKHPIYKSIKASCPVAEKVWKRLITLPLYPDLTDQEVQKIIMAVRSFSPKGKI